VRASIVNGFALAIVSRGRGGRWRVGDGAAGECGG
jgi:hypothetical protein